MKGPEKWNNGKQEGEGIGPAETEVPQSWDGRPGVGSPFGRVQGKRLGEIEVPSLEVVEVPLPGEGQYPLGRE